MSTEHKITLRSHLIALHGVLIFFALIIISLVLLFIFSDDDRHEMERIIGVVSILFLGPSIYLHFCYYLENKDFVMRPLEDGLEIEDYKQNKKWVLTNKTILSIDIYACANMVDWGGSGGNMLHLSYHYAIIKTNDDELILTSLLYPYLMDIKFKFNKVKVNYHKTIFADV